MKPDWTSKCGTIQLYNADCRDVLPTLAADQIIADPPYGIAYVKGAGGNGAHSKRNIKAIHSDDEPFDPSHLLRFGNVLLWGASHYSQALPMGRWLAWDKLDGMDQFDSFSDVEFAWHSRKGASRVFRYRWKGIACVKAGENNGARYHPTTKPLALMRWCIEQSGSLEGNVVCDPYMGSGSTGVACVQTGRKFIGVEIDQEHFDMSVSRITAELSRAPLFDPPAAVQSTMFDQITKD